MTIETDETNGIWMDFIVISWDFCLIQWDINRIHSLVNQQMTLQSGAPVDEIAFSWCVYNSNFTMVYGTYNYSIHGVYKPSNITGGPTL